MRITLATLCSRVALRASPLISNCKTFVLKRKCSEEIPDCEKCARVEVPIGAYGADSDNSDIGAYCGQDGIGDEVPKGSLTRSNCRSFRVEWSFEISDCCGEQLRGHFLLSFQFACLFRRLVPSRRQLDTMALILHKPWIE